MRRRRGPHREGDARREHLFRPVVVEGAALVPAMMPHLLELLAVVGVMVPSAPTANDIVERSLSPRILRVVFGVGVAPHCPRLSLPAFQFASPPAPWVLLTTTTPCTPAAGAPTLISTAMQANDTHPCGRGLAGIGIVSNIIAMV